MRYRVWVLLIVGPMVWVGCVRPGVEMTRPTDVGPAAGVVLRYLPNGMAVIVRPVRRAKVVYVGCYIRAGSMTEGEWLGCGLSHLTEHLVSEETIRQEKPGGRVARIGGETNAWTDMDLTCYHLSASSAHAGACVDLIADLIVTQKMTPAEFQREHGVVRREVEKQWDDPEERLWAAHAEDLFPAHPASIPVLGYVGPMSKLTLDDVRAYVARMYVPQNIVFVVVGDVDADAVLKRVEAKLGKLPRGRTPATAPPPVPPLRGVRRRTIPDDNVEEVIEQIGFQTVDRRHEDLCALDLLSVVLSSGSSSWLVRRLQFDRGLVTSIETDSWTPGWGRGSWDVVFRCDPKKADAAERAVLDLLRTVANEGVTATEVARAKRQMLAEMISSHQTVKQIANRLLVDYIDTGDVAFSRPYMAGILRTTAADLRAVAKKYLGGAVDAGNMVVTRIVPRSTVKSAATAVKAASRRPATVFTLPNGLRVVLDGDDSAGLVSMSFVTAGGVLAETPSTNGLGALMAALSVRGAGGRSAEEIAAVFEEAGGSIVGECGDNALSWQATVLNDRLDAALSVFADVIQRPTFSADQLAKVRPVALARIDRVGQSMEAELRRFFRRKFFDDSPQAMLPVGSKRVVETATPAQIRAVHRRRIVAGSSVLAVVGGFDVAAARAKIARLFASLPAGRFQTPRVASRRGGGRTHVLATTKKQAGVLVAVAGVTMTDNADRAALNVLQTILGGWNLSGGWLFRELRGKKLVYDVSATNWPGFLPGAFFAEAGTQPARAGQVVEIIRANLRKTADYAFTRQEVDEAVNVIVTAEALGNQTVARLSMRAALHEVYGLGWDYSRRLAEQYGAVTPAEVRRVAAKFFGGGGGYDVFVTTPRPELVGRGTTTTRSAR